MRFIRIPRIYPRLSRLVRFIYPEFLLDSSHLMFMSGTSRSFVVLVNYKDVLRGLSLSYKTLIRLQIGLHLAYYRVKFHSGSATEKKRERI